MNPAPHNPRGRLDDALALAQHAACLAHQATALADPHHGDDQLTIGETVLATALAVERLATTLIDQLLADQTDTTSPKEPR